MRLVIFFWFNLQTKLIKITLFFQKTNHSIVFLLLLLQVPKSRQSSSPVVQKCNSSLNSSSFQMSPTRSSIFLFKQHTLPTYLCSLCIKVCFIGQKEFSQRLCVCFPSTRLLSTLGFFCESSKWRKSSWATLLFKKKSTHYVLLIIGLHF